MKRRPRDPVYSTAVALGRGLFGLLRLRRTVTGAHHLPDAGGAVIAMTHFGYLDFALVEWVTWLQNRRHIRFMAKRSVFDRPLLGSLLRSMRHIPVDMTAGAAAYAHAVAALRDGELIGVFPEAGVSASFTVRELKTGAVRLAAEAGVPILPIAVWGGHRLLTKNHRVRFRDRFGVPVHFAIGTPIAVDATAVGATGDSATAVGATADARALTESLRAQLQALVDGLQSTYPLDGSGQWWQPRHLGGTAPTPEEAAAADEERRRRREASESRRT